MVNYTPEIPDFPKINPFLPCYGKFDLTTYIQGASDYEIMANLVQLYNTTAIGYNKVEKLSIDTVTAFNQLQDFVNDIFKDPDLNNTLQTVLTNMFSNGTMQKYLTPLLGYVTPEMFGAIGDGITDDTSAVQQAFDYVTTNKLNAVYLLNYYKCDGNITVENAGELTITGINMNKSRILMNNSVLTFGGDNKTNELRVNNITVNGNIPSGKTPLVIKNITNVTFQNCNFAESGKYLMTFDHADLVFIDHCTFAGSNAENVWLPCSGIEVLASNPIRVSNCNIWNMNTFIDVKGPNRTVSITDSWIEFIIKIINVENLINNLGFCLNHTIHNCNITYSPQGNHTTFEDAAIINYNNLKPGFNIVCTVSNNHIIYYNNSNIKHLISVTKTPEQTQFICTDNVLFTPLHTVKAYFVELDAAQFKLIKWSGLNIDIANACNIPSAVKFYNTSAQVGGSISVSSEMSLSDYTLWSGDGRMYYRTGDVAKTIIASDASYTIENINASSATTLDVANKLHDLIEVLYRSTIIRVP